MMAQRDKMKVVCEWMGDDGGKKKKKQQQKQVAQLSNEFMLPGIYNFFSHGMTSVKQQKLDWILSDRPAAHSTLQTKSFASFPLLLHVVIKNSQETRL